MTTLTKDANTGAFVGTGGRNISDLTGSTQDPYTIFTNNIAQMLTQAQAQNAIGLKNLGGAKDVLTNESIAPNGPVAFNPGVFAESQNQGQQTLQNAFQPAITSINTQMENSNANLKNITDIAGTELQAFKHNYSVQLNPATNNLGVFDENTGAFVDRSSSPSSSTDSIPSSGVPYKDALTRFNGGGDPHYADKVSAIKATIDSIAPQATADSLDSYILTYGKAPINGTMIMQVASQTGLDPNWIAAQLALESHFGMVGEAPANNNPGGLKWANQPGAVQGSEVPQSEGGGYYAKFKSPLDGLFAFGQLMQRTSAKASVPTSTTSNSSVSSLATNVANGSISYDAAYGQLSAIPSFGAYLANQLLPAVQKLKPDFNVNQSNAQSQAQVSNTQLSGTTSALVDKTNQTLDLLPAAFDKLGDFQKSGGSLLGGNLGSLSEFTGIGKANTDNYNRILAEARASANSVLSTAANLGVVTGGVTADRLLPDNMNREGLIIAIATIKDLEEKTKSALAKLSNASGGSNVSSDGGSYADYLKAIGAH